MSSGRAPWWMGVAPVAGAALLRAVGSTWRLRTEGLAAGDARLAAGERCIFAFWHARLLPLVFTHRQRDVAVLVSRHHDGELIARIIARLGFQTARGSSTRGGEEGMRELLRHAKARRLLGIAPDGPRGPAGRVKPGLVYLASRTGFPVLPVASAASPALRLRSWDGFRVPPPFARVVVGYGEPIAVPRALAAAEVEAWRLRIEEAIASLTERLDRLAAGEA